MGEQHADAVAREVQEVALRSRSHVPHGLENATAAGGDRLVVLAERAALVVVEPRRAEHGVRVTIHEARE